MEIVVEKEEKFARICKLRVRNKEFFTPIFFPSISSTELDFKMHYNWIIKQKPKFFMSSAYDLDIKEINQIKKLDSVTCLDSGGFELRKIQKPKKWLIEDYLEIIKRTSFDIVITLDLEIQREYSNKFFEIKNKILVNNYEFINSMVEKDSLIFFALSEYKADAIIKQIGELLSKVNPRVITIPEESLGVTFEERITSLRKISEKLTSMTENPVLIHIRGCSDPNSIIQYSRNGADIFDGLGWTRKVIKWIEIDEESLDLSTKWFSDSDQSKLMDCKCLSCKRNKKKEYTKRLFAHNLEAYNNLIKDLRNQYI